MKIGDKVVTRKTGQPGTGVIIGVFAPEFVKSQGHALSWDNLYPDWSEKPVYLVKFDRPQKPLSFDEYIEDVTAKYQSIGQPMPPEDFLEMEYLNNVPFVKTATYPADDLEIF